MRADQWFTSEELIKSGFHGHPQPAAELWKRVHSGKGKAERLLGFRLILQNPNLPLTSCFRDRYMFLMSNAQHLG